MLLPVISDESDAVQVVLALNNIEMVICKDMEIEYSVNAEKIGSAEINEILTSKALVAQAKVILFETKILDRIKELLDEAKAHAFFYAF